MLNERNIIKNEAGHGLAMFAVVFARPAAKEQRWYQGNPDYAITESGGGAM